MDFSRLKTRNCKKHSKNDSRTTLELFYGKRLAKNTLSLKNKKILSSRKNGQFWGCISQFINYAKNDSKTTLKFFYALCSNGMQFTALA